MKNQNSKIKKMKSGECRVIRINKDAILEFVQEQIMEDKQIYFDLPPKELKGLFYWTMDDKSGDIIICYSKEKDLDFDKVIEMVALPTTDSMYKVNRYISLYVNNNEGTTT